MPSIIVLEISSDVIQESNALASLMQFNERPTKERISTTRATRQIWVEAFGSGKRRGSLITSLDFDPLDFLDRKFLTSAIVELSRARRFVVRDDLGDDWSLSIGAHRGIEKAPRG